MWLQRHSPKDSFRNSTHLDCLLNLVSNASPVGIGSPWVPKVELAVFVCRCGLFCLRSPASSLGHLMAWRPIKSSIAHTDWQGTSPALLGDARN